MIVEAYHKGAEIRERICWCVTRDVLDIFVSNYSLVFIFLFASFIYHVLKFSSYSSFFTTILNNVALRWV